MSKTAKPEILASKIVAQSKLFTVEQLDLRFANGEERQYERMIGSNRGAVMIVPMLDPQTLLLVREYAAGTHSYELGFPKGLIDAGETALQAANRELQEEIGYGAKRFIPLMQLSLAPSYFASKMDILLAQDLYPSQLQGDEPEPLTLVPWSIYELERLLDQPDFSESRSVSALFLTMKALKINQ